MAVTSIANAGGAKELTGCIANVGGIECAIPYALANVDGIEVVIPFGEAEPELIEFTISGTSHQAEEGMTWGEWCDSEYNTDGYYVDFDDKNYIKIERMMMGMPYVSVVVDYDSEYVFAEDIIEPSGTYFE